MSDSDTSGGGASHFTLVLDLSPPLYSILDMGHTCTNFLSIL